ncbi:branched-chain amino acid ABC transporter permease [Phaeobacter inhibens]|uniref:branched-chain amino acid ABC transporter permease n=1 Tax=Phaeobacter inhibens TaxID=221822 RepID=UPI000160FA51|nr:branched-chain amino acid ABC transporter permease [Phaeobacter inhibens]AFO86149.1 branched-chain amino acid transport system permease protein [Phaeobacter inhibens 2.10]AXT40995.1 branched-chain amino acid ABC transporter permease [Phaeobacter inhibens]
MIRTLFSGDLPRSRVLALLLVVILICLAFAPFLFPGVRTVDTAARICIFIVLVASYDLLLGYGGIVSFAHTMFFGMGAYGVALTSTHMGRGFDALAIGAISGAALAAVLALLIGLFSLRVRAIFFAMITLAVASAVAVLVSQLSGLTGGEDGLTFKTPRELGPAFKFGKETFDGTLFGVKLNGKLLTYYLIFGGSALLFLALLRVVNSPFGRVLQAIRENDFRAEAIGYRVVYYRVTATCLSAAIAALSGSLYAIWLRYVGPDTTLSMTIMIDILLMVVIGGMGTIYGAVIGATLFVLAQNYLQNLMGVLSGMTEGLPLLPELLSPDRWLLWLGVLFILSVYFFPSGVVGRLRGQR